MSTSRTVMVIYVARNAMISVTIANTGMYARQNIMHNMRPSTTNAVPSISTNQRQEISSIDGKLKRTYTTKIGIETICNNVNI